MGDIKIGLKHWHNNQEHQKGPLTNCTEVTGSSEQGNKPLGPIKDK